MTRFERDELYLKASQNRRSNPVEAVDSEGNEDARTEDDRRTENNGTEAEHF